MNYWSWPSRRLVALVAVGQLACGSVSDDADSDAGPQGGSRGATAAGGVDASTSADGGTRPSAADAETPDARGISPDAASAEPADSGARDDDSGARDDDSGARDDDSGGPADAAGDGAPDAEVVEPPAPEPESLIPEAAEAVCAALFRCCDETGLHAYFDAFAASEQLAEFADRLPPDAATCPALLADMWSLSALGSWVEAARAGRVRIDAGALATCHEALAEAECGPPLLAALFDSSCFWLQPPAGGDQQRAIFVREASDGDACRPIVDGFGGMFYGTCDPQRAFCCHVTAAGDCGFPDVDGPDGVCRPAQPVGEACSQIPLQLCRTGLDCGDDGLCQELETAPLAPGDPCIDENYVLLGVCDESYCDVLGTHLCEPRREDGSPCMGADECLSQFCSEGACHALDLCQAP